MNIGAAIKNLREREGMSMRNLAAAVGVEASDISRWERGEHSINTRHLVPLSLALGTTPDRLIKLAMRGGK